jgi:hypothetical protein
MTQPPERSVFESFDFCVLDDPTFKEDAVREELVAPLLRRLGYMPSGEVRVQRSKALTHPFVRIGTRKHNVKIIPDYTLWYGDTALLVLDAKSPSESVERSEHVEQAYSYAIHPEVRARHYALCNGRRLVVFDTNEWDAILDVQIHEVDSRWADVQRVLLPRHLKEPILRNLKPDLGLAVLQMGFDPEEVFGIPACRLQAIGRISDDLYTGSCACICDGREYIASFDFPGEALAPMLSCLAEPLARRVADALSRSPYQASVDYMLELDLGVRLGRLTRGQHDSFVPFVIMVIEATRLNREVIPLGEELPAYIFSLRKAFDELRDCR